MADPEHVAKLEEGALAWNKWRKENPGVSPDLHGADLSGAKLSATVSGADLGSADGGLRSTLRLIADFTGAARNAVGKDERADLSKALRNLLGAELSDAARTAVSTDLSRADLGSASLRDADLFLVKLSHADLSNANLGGADLSNADLSNADLSNADLSEARLEFAALANTDLSGASLFGASLPGADLKGADLSGASLNGANLGGTVARKGTTSTGKTDLSGANLTEANLHGAVLTYTVLDEANLRKANFNRTSLGLVDLSTVQGLESVKHDGPSLISVETLYESKGQIPEVFLRGCGVPEEFIQYSRGLFSQAIEYYSCFISYSHTDKSFARRLHNDLQARGIRCWLDEHELLPGDDLYAGITQGIQLWDKTVLCCSRDSLDASWWSDKELEAAFAKERQILEERGDKVLALIPVDLDGYLFSNECRNPKATTVKERVVADFTGWETDNAKFERELEKVVKALRTDAGARKPTPDPKLWTMPTSLPSTGV